MENSPPPKPDLDRVPTGQKIGFSIGSMSNVLGSNSIGNLANFVFNIGLGVNPTLVGLGQSLPRLWDAITDPIMGHISDNTRTRWGRRRPYIFFGSIVMGILFALIWMAPTGWSEYGYFTYFLGTSLLFYTALTVFMVPWGAFGLEMTRDYHERTRIQAYGNFVGNVGALAMPWLFALTQLPVFDDGVQGAKFVGAGVGILLIVCGIIPALVCKESHYAGLTNQPKMRFWKGLKTTFQNRTFMRLMIAILFGAFGFFTVQSLTPYLIIYYLFSGDTQSASIFTGWNGTAWVVASMLFIIPVTWSATHFGKRFTFKVFMFIHLFGHLIKVVCYNPAYPWLVVIPPIFIAGGFVAMWTVGQSMMADICDQDELETGSRREGSFQAIYGWILKTSISLALLVGGLLLSLTGFDEALGGNQTADTILLMRILDIVIPSVAVTLCIITISRYSLTEEKVNEIHNKLENRRAPHQASW